MRLVSVGITLLLWCGSVTAQCRNGQCSGGVCVPAVPATQGCKSCSKGQCVDCPAQCNGECDEWVELTNDPGRLHLLRRGVQIGAWDCEKEYWRDYDAKRDVWGEMKEVSPIKLPVRPSRNFGVDTAQLGRGGKFELNGRPATRQQIDAAIADVPDDSKKFRLVATGSDEERKRVVATWKLVEPELASRVVVWNVPSDHWSLKDTVKGDTMFATGGITFQSPTGQVLHRQQDFTGQEDFGAIRKAVKAYDSGLDPDLRKPIIPRPVPGPHPSPMPPQPIDPPAPQPIDPPAPQPANPSTPLAPIGIVGVLLASLYLNRKG